jgi:hypothetical protein
MRRLNRAALNIITSTQALRTFVINDTTVNPNDNVGGWLLRCRAYYATIPDEVMNQSGLVKNDYDFRIVLDYTVTEEMMGTPHADLGIFLLDGQHIAEQTHANA